MKYGIDRTFFIKSGKSQKDDYKVIRKLDQGGVGEVFLVVHVDTEQIRTMKKIPKDTTKVAVSPMNEILLLRLLDHPNIVRIFEYY